MSKEVSDQSEELRLFVGRMQPAPINDIADELAMLGSRGAGWQRAGAAQWVRTLEQLVEDGKLNMDDRRMLTVAPIATPTNKQMTLFD